MSFLDTLPEAQQDEVRAALMAVAAIDAECRAVRDELAATDGPEAVAKAAYYDDNRIGPATAIEAQYRKWRDDARKQAAA